MVFSNSLVRLAMRTCFGSIHCPSTRDRNLLRVLRQVIKSVQDFQGLIADRAE